MAEGLDIQVSDETVPFCHRRRDRQGEGTAGSAPESAAGSSGRAGGAYRSRHLRSLFHQVGDTITSPDDPLNNSQYRITDIQIADSMPLDQYPKENYTRDYDSEVAPLLNEDGTLKPHERYLYSDGAD